MKRFGLVIFVLMVAGSMLFAACQPQTTSEAPAAKAEKGGTLVLREAGIVQFDPPFIADDASFHVASQVFSFLIRVAGGEVKPDLAETWEYQDDGKTIVFHLRQGVTFQDGNDVFAEGQGREVVAADVVYSFERMVTIEGNQTASDLVANFDSAEATDDYTVTLHLKNPDALLFSAGRGLTSVGILPKEAVEQLGDNWKLNPIGSGPFEFSSFVPDDSVTLIPNEDYRIQPNIEKLVYKVIPDDNSAVVAFEANEIQRMDLPAAEFERLSQDPNYKVFSAQCPASYNLAFNLAEPIFQDIEVRKALSHAIDGRSIMFAVYGEMTVPGCGIAGPGIPGYDEQLCDKYFAYDKELAAQTMTDAGWAKNADGIWEKDGQELAFQMEAWNMSPMPDIAAAVLTQLQEFGAKPELVQVEFGTWIADYTGGAGKPIMFWSGFCGEGGLASYWGESGLGRAMGYEDTDVFALINQSNLEIDPVKRNETLMQATDKIYGSYADIPLGFMTNYEITSAKLQDYSTAFWYQNLVTDFNNVWLSQ